MALPVLSTNQPLAGYISWTAFSLTYNGITYPIAASNTNKKFTWWKYNGGVAPALNFSDTTPALLTDDMLLFLNKSGVGVLVPYTDVIEGSLIVSGSILADAIGANQIIASHIGVDQINAGHVLANSIGAEELSAGAITTSKLTVGSISDNAVANGSFEDNTEGWTVMAGDGTADVVSGVASSGAKALRMVRATTNMTVRQDPAFYIPVSGTNGAKWYVSARAGSNATLASGFYLRVFWFLANKTTAATTAYTDVVANAGVTAAWTDFEGQVIPPANAAYMAISVYNANGTSTMYVDEVSAIEVVVAAKIADGAITALKIKAGELDAFKITGMNMQTSALANTGLKFDSTGIVGYGAGVPTFIVNSSDGSVDLAGNFRSGSGNSIFKATTAGIQLGNATFASAPFRVTAAGALTATGATISGAITATSGTFTGTVNANAGTFSGNITSTATISGGTLVGGTIKTSNVALATRSELSQTYGFESFAGGVADGMYVMLNAGGLAFKDTKDAANATITIDALGIDFGSNITGNIMGQAGINIDGGMNGLSLNGSSITVNGVSGLLDDSGWQNITVSGGFAASGTPRVRLVGNVLWFLDGFSNTGMAINAHHNVGVLPVGYRPNTHRYVTLTGHSAATSTRCVIQSDGVILISTGPALPNYARLDGISLRVS